MTLPLKDVRILDLSRVLAGPLAGMILGDLGADVIKIERSGSGDDTRGWGPPFDDRGESAYFLSVNRNKLSVAADLTLAADRELLARLIGEADVVLENFRPGTLERHGLGPAAMLAAHPELLWCTITGFGLESPRPGYDFVVQAESGWMAITGEPDGAPMKVGVALADVLAGKEAAIQILGALAGQRGARRTSRSANRSSNHSTDSGDTASFSRHLTVSLLHSATAALVNVAQNALVTGAEAVRWGNAHPNLVPYQVFEAADRPMVIAVGNDGQFAACVRALGLDALAADSALVTNAGRVTHRARVVEAIAAHVRSRSAESVMQALDAVGVPCGVVKPVLEALRAVEGSALTGVAPQGPTSVRRPPPRLDAHGASVRTHGWGAFLRGEGAEDV
jgi:crotonobetainyl-CoA:carnitine CoA-transferase CaiB-like acyl-CoA transferase